MAALGDVLTNHVLEVRAAPVVYARAHLQWSGRQLGASTRHCQRRLPQDSNPDGRGLLNGSERAVYPDLARGGLSFKKAQAEEAERKQQPLL